MAFLLLGRRLPGRREVAACSLVLFALVSIFVAAFDCRAGVMRPRRQGLSFVGLQSQGRYFHSTSLGFRSPLQFGQDEKEKEAISPKSKKKEKNVRGKGDVANSSNNSTLSWEDLMSDLEDLQGQVQSYWGEAEEKLQELRQEAVKFWDDTKEQRKQIALMTRKLRRNLASLSLKDYEWRRDVFKRNEADRLVESSLARMMGEEPSYVRPMDADDSRIGPLGRAERQLVAWLMSVIEEEGQRAERIANSDGDLVRPVDLDGSGFEGPLSNLEKQAVGFLQSIRDSESERLATRTLRPKDLQEGKRGPLGEAEARAVSALEEIKESERTRMEQSKQRGGAVVRPIDIPGPLGEWERTWVSLALSEKQRVRDRTKNEGRLVRPMNASLISPIGEAEQSAMDAITRLAGEEKERLSSIQKFMEDRRPMENDKYSALGLVEVLVVLVLRSPQLLWKELQRFLAWLQELRVKFLGDEEKVTVAMEATDDDDNDKTNDDRVVDIQPIEDELGPFA